MQALVCRTDRSEIEQKRRIEAAAKDQLRRSAYYAVRRVSCEFDGDVLKLRGRVPSYYEKQVAQSLVLQQLESPIDFENQLEVGTAATG